MPPSRSTCWTTIERAAAGDRRAREEFAERYAPLVRAYLAARWRCSHDSESVSDAVQEVFVECFRTEGVLERLPSQPPQEFRAFLYGVVRNVALRAERDLARDAVRSIDDADLAEVESEDRSASQVFDRAWAESIVAEAAELLARRARDSGPEAVRRVEILRLRFGEGQPIRAIAGRLGADAARVHRQYRTAREEYRRTLVDVLRFHYPESREHSNRALDEVLSILAGLPSIRRTDGDVAENRAENGPSGDPD